MKHFLLSTLILTAAFSQTDEFCINPNQPESLDSLTKIFLKANPSAQNVEKSLIKKKIQRDLVFSKAYIDSLNETQRKELELNLLDIIANFHLKQYLSGFKIDEEEKVLKSYYVTHKEDYPTPATIDIHKIEFSESKLANDFKDAFVTSPQEALTSISATSQTTTYSRIPKQNLSDYYRFILEDLEPLQPSSVIPDSGKYVVFYYDNPIKAGFLPFDATKEQIRNTLIEKKRREIIDSYFNELTSSDS